MSWLCECQPGHAVQWGCRPLTSCPAWWPPGPQNHCSPESSSSVWVSLPSCLWDVRQPLSFPQQSWAPLCIPWARLASGPGLGAGPGAIWMSGPSWPRSGSALGSWPRSFFHSVLFRAFSPRPPCFRLGKVPEMLPSVVTPEPFGLNSKCGRQRFWGVGVVLQRVSPCLSSWAPGSNWGVLVRGCPHW